MIIGREDECDRPTAIAITLATVDDVAVTSNVKGALVGAIISGGAALAWSLWGASGLSGAASMAVRVAGTVIGLIIILWCAYLWRSAPAGGSGSGTMFSSPAYRLIAAAEVLALIGGNVFLDAIGHREYTIAWVATVVGIHFLGFGRRLWVGFYRLGAALIAAGIIGAIVGLAGGNADAIEATAGLITAASFLVAGTSTILRVRKLTDPGR
jgi:hypothetical protein